MLSRVLFLLTLSACYLRSYPLTPSIVSQSTFKLMADEGGGTAWAVGPYHLVSAGHVCDMTGPFRVEGTYRRFLATPVVWWHDGEGKRDVCVLKTSIKMDSWLIIASTLPEKGAKIGYVGYPMLQYGEFDGEYLGDLDGKDTWNDYAFSAPCAPGASGSPVYSDKGVWGVLVRLRTDGGYIHPGDDGCVATGLPVLREILQEAGVNYNVPPEIMDDI